MRKVLTSCIQSQYTYDRQADRQTDRQTDRQSLSFCVVQNNIYIEQTGVLRPRFFRGRDAPFLVGKIIFQGRYYETTK